MRVRPDVVARNKSEKQRKALSDSWRNPEIKARRIEGLKTAIKKNKWMIGNKSHWKGNSVGYRGLHDWINNERGKATRCVNGCIAKKFV